MSLNQELRRRRLRIAGFVGGALSGADVCRAAVERHFATTEDRKGVESSAAWRLPLLGTALEEAAGASTPVRVFPRVLDLGCGLGRSSMALRELLPESEIVAADWSAAVVARARARSGRARGVEFVTHERGGLPYESQSFDLAVFLNAVPDVEEGLRVARTVVVVFSHGRATPLWSPLVVHEARARRRGAETELIRIRDARALIAHAAPQTSG